MNINWRKKLIENFKDFQEICVKNDIWYAMDKSSLLGAVRHSGFLPWKEKVEVMMTPEAYTKFERKAKERAIDNYKYNWYKNNCPVFTKSEGKFLSIEPFVQIRIIIPTSKINIRKYQRLIRRFTDWLGRTNYKDAISDLKNDKNFSGYKLIDNKRLRESKYSWLQSMNFETETKSWNNIKVNVSKNYDFILQRWFGENYLKSKVPEKYKEYPNPHDIIYVNQSNE